jgi:hypothetical protein
MPMEPSTKNIDYLKINYWITNNFNAQSIEKELLKSDCCKEEIDLYIKAFTQTKIKARQNSAFIFLLLGSFVGFLSFVLSVTNLIPNLHSFFLYGLTSISVLIIFIGLYYLFE